MANLELIAAVIGLVLEVAGLWILLGKNNANKLKALSRKKLDGLDEWQDEIDKALENQRKKHLRSSVFIVVGIFLQTFPGYIFCLS